MREFLTSLSHERIEHQQHQRFGRCSHLQPHPPRVQMPNNPGNSWMLQLLINAANFNDYWYFVLDLFILSNSVPSRPWETRVLAQIVSIQTSFLSVIPSNLACLIWDQTSSWILRYFPHKTNKNFPHRWNSSPRLRLDGAFVHDTKTRIPVLHRWKNTYRWEPLGQTYSRNFILPNHASCWVYEQHDSVCYLIIWSELAAEMGDIFHAFMTLFDYYVPAELN